MAALFIEHAAGVAIRRYNLLDIMLVQQFEMLVAVSLP